jgi:hypothetical protein
LAVEIPGVEVVPTALRGIPIVLTVAPEDGAQYAIWFTPKWGCSRKSRPEGRMTSSQALARPVAGVELQLHAGRVSAVQTSRSRSRTGSPWMRKATPSISIRSPGRESGTSATRRSSRVVSD